MRGYKILFISLSLLLILGVGPTPVRAAPPPPDDVGNNEDRRAKERQALESLLLLHGDEPSLRGVTRLFKIAEKFRRVSSVIDTPYFNLFVEGFDALLRHHLPPASLFMQRARKGHAYQLAYRQQVLDQLQTPEAKAVGVYLGDPLREILDSLNDLERKQRENTHRPPTQSEAEMLAKEEMRKKYPDFEKKDDPLLRREYQRLVNRYLLGYEIFSHHPVDAKNSKKTLDEWKRLQIVKIEHIIKKNLQAVLKILFEIKGESLYWWEARSFHPDDIPLTEIRDGFVILPKRDLRAGKDLTMLIGEEGISFTLLYCYDYAIRALEERGDFFKTTILDKTIIESNYLFWFKQHLESNLKLDISEIRREIERNIEEYAREQRDFLTMSAGQGIVRIFSNYLLAYRWWGYSKGGFDYWKEKEKRAKDSDKPEFPLPSLEPTRVGPIKKSKPFLPDKSVQLKTNISKEENEKNEKVVYFRLRPASLFSELPDSFEIPYLEEVDHCSPIEIDGKGKKEFSIETAAQTPADSTYSVIVIPKPIGFELTALTVRDSSGKELRVGTDYEIIGNIEKNALFIKILSNEKKSYSFLADFGKGNDTGGPRNDMPKLDSDRLLLLAEELEKSGLIVLSQNLKKLIESAKKLNIEISITDLETLFKESALYSYQPDHKTDSKTKGEGGIFDSYRRFLNEEGRLCAQCNATNQLFADALRFCFPNNPDVVIETRTVLVRDGYELRKSGYHLRTYIYLDSKPVAVLDATPAAFDKRDALANKAQPLEEKEEREKKREEILAERLEKDIQTLKNDRKELLKNESIYSENKVRNLDSSEPFIRAMKLNGILIAFLEGEIDLSQAGQRLEEIYSDKKGAFQNISDLMIFIREAAREENERLKRATGQLRRGEMRRFTYYSDPIFSARIEQAFLHIEQILGNLDAVSVLRFLGRNLQRRDPSPSPRVASAQDDKQTAQGDISEAKGKDLAIRDEIPRLFATSGFEPRNDIYQPTFAGSLAKFSLAVALKEALKEAFQGKEANFSHIFTDEQVVGYGAFSLTAAAGTILPSPYRLGSYAFFMTLGMQADQIARLTLAGIKDRKDVTEALGDALGIWWSQFEADEAALTTAGFLAAKPIISKLIQAIRSGAIERIRTLQRIIRATPRVVRGGGGLALSIVEEAIVLLVVDVMMEEYVTWKKDKELQDKIGAIFKSLSELVRNINKENARESAAQMSSLFEELRMIRLAVIHTEKNNMSEKYNAFQSALGELIDHKSGLFWKDAKAIHSAWDVRRSPEYSACLALHQETFGGGDYDGSQYERTYRCEHLAFLKMWAKKLGHVKKLYLEYQVALAQSENKKYDKRSFSYDFLKSIDLEDLSKPYLFDIKHTNQRDLYQLEQSYYRAAAIKVARRFPGIHAGEEQWDSVIPEQKKLQTEDVVIVLPKYVEDVKTISEALNEAREQAEISEVVFETAFEQISEEEIGKELKRDDLLPLFLTEVLKEDRFWIELSVGARNGTDIWTTYNPTRIHVMNETNCILSEMLEISHDVISLEDRDERSWLSCDQFQERPLSPDESRRRESLEFFIGDYFAF